MDLNLKQWNWNSYKAVAKHFASAAAGAVGLAVTWHFVSPTQGTEITDNVNHVINGFQELITGLGGLIATGTLIYNSLRSGSNASPINQAVALEAAIPGTKIITSDEIAKATPDNPNILSQTEVKIVLK